MRRESSPPVFEAIFVLVVLAAAATGAGRIGWFIGNEMAKASASATNAG